MYFPLVKKLNHVEEAPLTPEVLTLPEGLRPLRDANKLLRAYGLALRWRKAGGDQVLVRIEKLP